MPEGFRIASAYVEVSADTTGLAEDAQAKVDEAFAGVKGTVKVTLDDSDLDAKAAALLHSIARNHALVDGNKRLALAAVIAFCGLNGRRLTLTNDQAYDLVINVAAGQLDDADAIAAILRNATQPRR